MTAIDPMRPPSPSAHMNKFRADYGVFVCPHVFEGNTDVLFAVRDFDGSWQFLCGADHDAESEAPRHVGVDHLAENDSSIHELTALLPGQFASRQSRDSDWTVGDLDPA